MSASSFCFSNELTPKYKNKSFGLNVPNDPVAVDLNGDGTIEILLTDISGNIIAINSQNGSIVWKNNIKNVVLTSPVVGDFYGNQTLAIAVCGSDNRLYIFESSTGEILGSQDLGDKATISPSILSISSSVEGENKDAIVVVNQKNEIQVYEIYKRDDKDFISGLWNKSYVADEVVETPLTIDDLTGDGFMDILVGLANRDVVLIDGKSGEKVISVNVKKQIIGSIAVGLTNLGQKYFVVMTKEEKIGYLSAYSVVPASLGNGLIPIWKEGDISLNDPIFPPILTDIDGDKFDDIIVANQLEITAYNGKVGSLIWSEKTKKVEKIVSPLALIKADSGNDKIIFQDNSNFFYMWDISPSGIRTHYVPVKNPTQSSFLVFDANKDNLQDIFFVSRKSDVSLYSTDVANTKYEFGWFSEGGNFYQTNSFNLKAVSFYDNRINALRNKINNLLTQSNDLFQKKSWKEAYDISCQILQLNPAHKEAKSLRTKSWIRHHLLLLILYSIAIISIFVYSVVKILSIVIKNRDMKKAHGLLETDNYEDTIPIYEKQLKKFPNDEQIIKELSDSYIKVGDYKESSIIVFEKAYNHSKEDKYLVALIDVNLNDENTSRKALNWYLKGREIYENKADLELMIGKIFKNHDKHQEAIKALRNSLHQGKETQEVYELLSDLYLITNMHSAKAYEVFQNVYPYKKDNIEFLKAFCESYIEAKRLDDRSEELAKIIIGKAPDFVPAYILLANTYLQKNKISEAYNCCVKVLSIEPENAEGLLIMSLCYLSQDRADKKAEECYEKTLKCYPENSEILKALSHIYIGQGRADNTAYNVFINAYNKNPKDSKILLMLAKIANMKKDYGLSIQVITKLNQLGHYDADTNLQLATAYIEKDDIREEYEKCFLEALHKEGMNIRICKALASIYIKQKRVDKHAISIFEIVLKQIPDSPEIAKHLINAYINYRQYAQAVDIAKKIMALHPNDPEMQKLYARANLSNNQLDEAIQEYQNLLVKNPNDKDAILNLAIAYSYKNKIDDTAFKIYNYALKIEPNNEEIHIILAKYYLNQGSIDKTIEEFDKAFSQSDKAKQRIVKELSEILNAESVHLKLRWYFVDTLINVGYLNEASDELSFIYEYEPSAVKEIIEKYSKILKRDSNNVKSLQKVGVLLKSIGNIEQAKNALEKAHKLVSHNTDIMNELASVYENILRTNEDSELRLKLGNIYYDLGEYDKAIGCFQRTMKNFKTEQDSTKMLGKCFVAKGMLDLAMQEFKKLPVDADMKEILYDLAQRYEAKSDLVGAKTIYKQLFAADITFKNVKDKFELLAGTTTDPQSIEETAIIMGLSEKAKQRYEFLEEIGRGAMGIVFKARDSELDEIVALKILPDNLSNNPEAISRFKREARSARKLSHPNIVRIHDIGEEMGRKYISMEYVEGDDLRKTLKEKGPFDEKTTISIAKQISSALDYAHQTGIIHRDVKPANMMLTKDNVIKVTDFGIAKVIESTESTMAGAIIGTPLYMSPEQIRGQMVDNRADIYSLGILLYELASGKPPFYEGDLAYQHLNIMPKDIEAISKELNDIILKCIAKEKDKRWSSSGELNSALNKL